MDKELSHQILIESEHGRNSLQGKQPFGLVHRRFCSSPTKVIWIFHQERINATELFHACHCLSKFGHLLSEENVYFSQKVVYTLQIQASLTLSASDLAMNLRDQPALFHSHRFSLKFQLVLRFEEINLSNLSSGYAHLAHFADANGHPFLNQNRSTTQLAFLGSKDICGSFWGRTKSFQTGMGSHAYTLKAHYSTGPGFAKTAAIFSYLLSKSSFMCCQ